MRVTVRLLVGMKKFLPKSSAEGDTCELILDDGATVRSVLASLRIPEDMPKTVLINRLRSPLDAKLEHGDTVSVFEPVSGG